MYGTNDESFSYTNREGLVTFDDDDDNDDQDELNQEEPQHTPTSDIFNDGSVSNRYTEDDAFGSDHDHTIHESDIYSLLQKENLTEQDVMRFLGLSTRSKSTQLRRFQFVDNESNIDDSNDNNNNDDDTNNSTTNMILPTPDIERLTNDPLRPKRRGSRHVSIDENSNRALRDNNMSNNFRSHYDTTINNNNITRNINNNNNESLWLHHIRQENQIAFQMELENTLRRYLDDPRIDSNDILHIPIPIPRLEQLSIHHHNNQRHTTATASVANQNLDRQNNDNNVARGDHPNNGNNHNHNDHNHLTLRRILIAVIAVTTAFLCTMIQTLPLYHKFMYLYDDEYYYQHHHHQDYDHYDHDSILSSSSISDYIPATIDTLVYELVYIKHFIDHIQECPNLSRQYITTKKGQTKQTDLQPNQNVNDINKHNNSTFYHKDHEWYRIPQRRRRMIETKEHNNFSIIFQNIYIMIQNICEKIRYVTLNTIFQWKYWIYEEIDCSDGVLHIPSQSLILNYYQKVLRNISSLPSEHDKHHHHQEIIRALQPYVAPNGIHVIWSLPCGSSNSNDDDDDNNESRRPHRTTNTTMVPVHTTFDVDEICASDKNFGINRTEHGAYQLKEKEDDTSNTLWNDPRIEDQPEVKMNGRRCFRGIHDNVVTSTNDIINALQMGASITSQKGSNHFDIHYHTNILYEYIPNIVNVIQTLLMNRYTLDDRTIQPIAFRVTGVGSITGTDTTNSASHNPNHYNHSNYYNEHDMMYQQMRASSRYRYLLQRIINRTTYIQWMDRLRLHNELAQFNMNIPWPFRIIYPKRDVCHLMYDQAVNDTFTIHTNLFLSDNNNHDYTGGTMLYVDDDYANVYNVHDKIRRGVIIDGNIGRLIVSTGGIENLHCRLPTRAGTRATLQIWWNYV